MKPGDKPDDDHPKKPGKESLKAPLPKRFYKLATVESAAKDSAEHVQAATQEGAGARYRIMLDGRPVKTPRKLALGVRSAALAEALAAEWNAQGSHIDPATMPLTRLVNTAIDGVALHMPEVAGDIVRYAGSDLLLYRAEAPAALVHLQQAAWDPVLAWANTHLGARLAVTSGVMPRSQQHLQLERIARALKAYDALQLTALHEITTLTGSALLALAHANGRLSARQAWDAAHVDEDWQISQWGEDSLAKAHRAFRWSQMAAACRLLALLD